jgi:multiple sugar transport system substrate-binding protein
MKMKATIRLAAVCSTILAALGAGPALAGELRIWIRASNDSRMVYEDIARAFEQKTGTRIDYFNATTDFEQRLARAAAGHVLPDLVFTDAAALGQMRQMGILEEVDRDGLPGAGELYPAAWDSARAGDGRYYAVPVSVQSFALFIRKDWREKLGLPQPRTWGDLRKLAEAFTREDPDGNGRNDTYGFILPASTTRGYASWFMSSFLWQAGGGFLKEAGNGLFSPAMAQPANVEALAFMRGLVCDGLTQPGAINATTADVVPSFRSGQAGMFFSGPYHIALFDKEPGRDKIEVTEPPTGPGGAETLAEGTNAYFMKDSAEREAARQFVAFFISPEAQTLGMAVGSGHTPVVRLPVNRKASLNETFDDPRWRLFGQLYADQGRYVPAIPNWTPVRMDTADAFNRVFADCNSDIAAILRQLDTSVAQELKEQGVLAP